MFYLIKRTSSSYVCDFGGVSKNHSISFLLVVINPRFVKNISQIRKTNSPIETRLIREPKEERIFQVK